MKVEFIKDHNDNKAGDVVDVADGLAKYLIKVGAVVESGEKDATPPRPKPVKEKVQHTRKREKATGPKGKEKNESPIEQVKK